MNRSYKIYLPIAFSAVLALGMLLGARFNGDSLSRGKHIFFFQNDHPSKLNEILRLVNQKYVDSIDISKMEAHAIGQILSTLDPHSTYIGARDLQSQNESLEGNFDGIGVEFYLLHDTIYVVSAIPGGPSEALGIKAGDKIIRIDQKKVTGKKLQNSDVVSLLRGASGTKVVVTVLRKGQKKFIDFVITRGKIPLNSIETFFMLGKETGYIKINTFGSTTYEEFLAAMANLDEQGMKKLVLDLRGNPGGFLTTAIALADEFLPKKKLIVYTEGRHQPRREEYSSSEGNFETGPLVILIDEGSASASEIVAGAVQDWDRGLIIGRRSFGKGLVQDQSLFPDGSALRLTIARYYTPVGRSIQKPYDKGLEAYNNDLISRAGNGELLYADSNRFNDSLKYKTPAGRTVYGGGGIMPDIFVPMDTSAYSGYLTEIMSKGLLADFAYDYSDRNKSSLRKYKSFEEFRHNFYVSPQMLREFAAYCRKRGVKDSKNGMRISGKYISLQIKALMARQLWNSEGYYKLVTEKDPVILRALREL